MNPLDSRALCLLLALAGCDRSAEPPPAPPPSRAAADAAAAAPKGGASDTPPATPISVMAPGKKRPRLPTPKTPKLGPEGPTTARTTSPAVYLRNLEAQRTGLEARLKRKPDDPAAMSRMAAWHLEKGQLDGDLTHALSAEELLDRAIAKTDTPALRVQRAGVRAHLHRFAEANVDLRAALAKTPDNDRVSRALGWNLHQLGRYAEARPLLDTPHVSARTYSDYGREAVLLFEQGRIEEADRRLRLAYGAYSDVHPVPLAWIDLQRGLLRLRTGRHDAARAFFKAAYDRLPAYFLAAEHLAETEALLGNHARALALYDDVVRATRLPEFMGARAGVLKDMGQAEASARALKATDARWRTLVARHEVAVAGHAVDFWLEDLPRPADAKKWADLNLKARRDAATLVQAARAAAAAKDPARAKELLVEAAAQPRKVDEFYAGMADAWHRLGDAEQAATWLAKARELNPKTPGL